MMKVLIWIGCILVASVFRTFLQMEIGVDSPLLIYLATCAVARHFCKKLDEKRASNREETTSDATILESGTERIFSDSVEEVSQREESIQTEPAVQLLADTEICNVSVSKETDLNEKQPVMESTVASNPFDILKRLNELHNDGILTDEEYSEKKKEILNRI